MQSVNGTRYPYTPSDDQCNYLPPLSIAQYQVSKSISSTNGTLRHIKKPTGRFSSESRHHQLATLSNQPASSSSQQCGRFTSSQRLPDIFTSTCRTRNSVNKSRDDEIRHDNLLLFYREKSAQYIPNNKYKLY